MRDEPAEDVLRFIADRIDSVPEIEALLLLWERRPDTFTVDQLARNLYVSEGTCTAVIRTLEQRRFVTPMADGSGYAYDSAWEVDPDFMARVAATYRRHLIRVATLIHSKAPAAVLEFARAFEPKRDT